MRLIVLAFTWLILTFTSHAFDIEDRTQFGEANASAKLTIISTTDIGFFRPVIDSFLEENPEVSIDYLVVSSSDLAQAVMSGEQRFDLAISSAMDLQTKLANDGYAQTHSAADTQNIPNWAVWNDMLFAFTQEPAATVVSKQVFQQTFGDAPIPKNRNALIALLREHSGEFKGRIGTYDIRKSGLGYLFATQDTRASDTYWRLTEVMGNLNAKLFCCSSDMIEAVKSGDLLVAYNVLGSYVASRNDHEDFTIIMPDDFTTVMLRTAMIPKNASSPILAGSFIDHLIGEVYNSNQSPFSYRAIDLEQNETSLNRIGMGPGLLVFLDQLKKRAFLTEWQNAILQP